MCYGFYKRIFFFVFFLLGVIYTQIVSAKDPYFLKPEWAGSCQRENVIDVNRGNTSVAFVRAAYCQILGKEPDQTTVALWSKQLETNKRARRIDIIRTICKQSRRQCQLRYSNPWQEIKVPLVQQCHKKQPLDIGAIMMFFFHCPGGVNCNMDWANTHAYGMDHPHSLLGWGTKCADYYNAGNIGFWRRELEDAKLAGLQFILPNTYGPDLWQEGKIKTLAIALAQETNPVKVGLFDDTWTWGEKWFGPYWQEKPDFQNPEQAAQKLYQAKWKPFFSQIPRQYWYQVNRKPFIYFYNAGKLTPRRNSAAVISRMKALFRQDFNVEPFVVIDHAYFDDPTMPQIADGEFKWNTWGLPHNVSRYKMNGRTIAHAMVKWDAIGRDYPGIVATSQDRLMKGPETLQNILINASDADILVLATWNDLGEGTGINRNYDYYYLGNWLPPDYFMQIIRKSHCY